MSRYKRQVVGCPFAETYGLSLKKFSFFILQSPFECEIVIVKQLQLLILVAITFELI